MKRTFEVTSGSTLRCLGWRQEALLRLLENVLAVGENPDELVVYAALGRAARDWPSHDAIVHALKTMREDQTLLVQSGKPIGLLQTHANAPLVIMANCNMVGQWAKAENFYRWEKENLICWGGLTAGDWQYIGSQGVIQGTYEIFSRIAERHFDNDLRGRFILTAGLGGMGGAQPLAGTLANAAILTIEVNQTSIDKRLKNGFLQYQAADLDQALMMIAAAQQRKEALSVALLGNAAEIYPAILARGVIPDIVTDQTAAHDLVYGYVPAGYSPEQVAKQREDDINALMDASRRSIVQHVQAMIGFMDRGAVVFDNGNLIRTHAHQGGVERAFEIPIFTEAFLRPLFCRAIGPFRWIALSNNSDDIRVIDDYLLERFADNRIVSNWITLARQHVPFEGLPARIAWLGHGERTELALEVNRMVADGRLSGPIAFTRDHLDAGAMTHPNIMTEKMKDGSDAIADWPLLNALVNCASMADLVAIHSGGGGYSGYMTSSGVTTIADGSDAAAQRLQLSMTNDTTTGVMRYADAGYQESLDEIADKSLPYISLPRGE
ncbi:Urocanate hydratase [Serratia proteamaculans]|jgi:urocanate hydratase|uniref:urocanate hydratase n=1 Tax=Serratia proteamaculans TaxID=28151 RepID=UPI00101FB671|nr:urocanate hydratase [Serratia proteamaculans]KAB1498199.1 urocanate hydratase [Serratia proteamaculans]NWA70907.1 urocanate hydratase [Serratia proteamaculans]RYM56269.1 urocanate hydratase [Serratia proteamaculans]CAI0726041.1 Urocanate hydratase [Serratia proteamaculans]CAI0842255.1 Urocanate hydratase [Serratia proteamaculans]